MKPAQQRRYVQFLQAIYVVFGLLIALLIVSVLLMALAANPCAALTSLDYGATTLLVAPFQGIIATPTSSSSAVLEFSSVVATFVYALMAWVIVRLIVILRPRRRTPTSA